MIENNQKTTSNLGIIFIHGAGLGEWIWRDVTPQLAVPYTYANYAELFTHHDMTPSLDDYVDVAYRQALELGTETVLVVAHSVGGVVGVELAKRLGNKLAGFAGICAAIPKPGQSYVSVLPMPQKLLMPVILKIAGTRPPESQIRSGLGNDLTQVQADEVVEKFVAESIHLYLNKTSSDPLPAVPCFYLKTTQDAEFTTAMQDKIIKNLPDAQTLDVPSGHLPMLSHPTEVAAFLRRVIAEL